MIAAVDLTMRFGGKILFQNASFQLLPKTHYGLVGPNGSGKSTLLKLISGEMTPDKGEIAIPSLTKIGSLKQDHFAYEQVRINDVVLMGKPALWAAIEKKEALLQSAHFTEEECHLLADCEKVIEQYHGYSASSRASELLEGLGIPTAQHEKTMSTLSGGYKLRVLIAQLLFSDPDILLLDEPTNHLDIFSIRWLELYLQSFQGIILVCSHDKLFLNNVADTIVDIDYGTINLYKGNYDAFTSGKAEDFRLREATFAKQQKKREDMMEFVDRFRAKASEAAQAQSRLKAVEKLEAEMGDAPVSTARRRPHLQFDQSRPSGAWALKVDQLSKAYGDKQVLHGIAFEVERGEKVALLGANGIGKSTLLQIITGNAAADAGTHTWGYAVEHAYFPQDHSKSVEGSLSLLDWLWQFDPPAKREQLQNILGRVLFSGDDVKKPTSVLSGGETARLILAKLMLIRHNVLIFDEPTNHLDIEATDALIEALENYEGTLLIVSHNRHFIDRTAKRIIELSTDGIKDYRCTYAEYALKREQDLLDRNAKRSSSKQKSTEPSPPSKHTFTDTKKVQRQKEQLERKVAEAEKKCHALEDEIQRIDQRLSGAGFFTATPAAEQESIFKEKERLEGELAKAMHNWETLYAQSQENSPNPSL